MPNIQEFDAGNLKLQPTEVGVEARAGTARRIGMFYNQQAGAVDTLARETSRLAGETSKLGSETAALGAEKGAALSETGRRLGSSVADAGAVAVKYLDNQQISQGAPAFARMMNQKSQQWSDLLNSSDLNDPTVAQKFLDGQLEPAIAKFKEGFYTEGGQQWAEAHTDALRQHMVEQTHADMMNKQGMAAVVNHQQTVNETSSTAYNNPDKSTLDFSIATLKSSTEGMLATGNYTPEVAGRMRTELLQKGIESTVKSAAIGYIEKTGQLPPWINDPKYAPYIKGDEIKMFQKAALAQQHRDELIDKQQKIAQAQIANTKVHQGVNEILANKVGVDPQTGRPIIAPDYFKDVHDLVKNNPDATDAATAYRTMTDWAEAQQNKKAPIVSDPATTQLLDDHIFAPDPETGKYTTVVDLMKARMEGKITDHDFTTRKDLVNELEKAPLQGPVWQSTMQAVKDSLIVSVPGLPGKDNVGVANYSKFVQTFIPQYIAAERAGRLPPNALDVKDPNSMISQSLSQFKRSPADRMSDFVKGAQGEGGVGTISPAANQMVRMVGDTPVPKSLSGVASLQYNKAKGLWRDQTSGTIYDAKGNEVKP